MSLTSALYSAIGNGAVKMGIVNPECYDDTDDEWDVEPTSSIQKIVRWMHEVDNLPVIVFFNEHDVKLGTWVVLNDSNPLDKHEWLSDCDTGDWTERTTDGHY